MQPPIKSVRTYCLREFARDLVALLKKIPGIVKGKLRPKISKAFEEKIMLIITGVNGCPYCAWVHGGWALKSNVALSAVQQLLQQDLKSETDEWELIGLAYALHYAEINRNPDSQMTREFEEYYGRETAEEIMLHFQIIFFGNLCGNTYKEFFKRDIFRPSKSECFLGKMIISLFCFPLFGPISIVMKMKGRKY